MAQGWILMALGMGVVFVFLTLLVLVMKGMSALVLKFFPEKVPAELTSGDDAEIAAAIAAATAYAK